jgi:hypothetical protein
VRLDIRLPLGLLFMVFGLLLSGFGLISDKALYQRSLSVNVNLWWGLAMLAFGLIMFGLGRRSNHALASPDSSAESRGKSASDQ